MAAPPLPAWQPLRVAWRLTAEAYSRFVETDGWAISSHIALSALMSLFPFLIVVAAVGGFFGSKDLADEAARLLLEAWPKQVAGPIAVDIQGVLVNVRSDVLTLGVVFAVYFAASGVESLRIGLNRAYHVVERRNWLLLRLESIGYVLVGAIGLLVFAFFVVLAPLIWSILLKYIPELEPLGVVITFVRFGVAAVILIAALIVVHLWLPAGHRRLRDIIPGIVATLLLWLVSGAIFGAYLANYAFNYFTMYAGLASAVIALFFLYITSSIFIFGGELNAAVMRRRQEADMARSAFPANQESD